MQNQFIIEPTLFINQRTNSLTVGWRAHDDHYQAYDNTWHDGTPSDDMEFLKKVLKSNDEILWTMISYCQRDKRGLFISTKFYPWNEIKDHIEETGKTVDYTGPGYQAA